MKKPRGRKTTLSLPPSLWKEVKILAVKRDVTAAEIVRWALEAYLKKGDRE
jgi:hypothetical protein